ncbi:MAG: Glu-tRNA(Gln) amidotransferase subunit GatE, partial [archaeon]
MKLQDIENIDYKKTGLCCGLEIHQQLDTNKLFCKCKSKLIKDGTKPDRIIKRKLRAVYSETGEFDETALMEQKKAKTNIYYFYNSCNCLVDADCQPPIRTSPDALKIAVIISSLTNSHLVDKSIVMRKQVIDGSNVSGFQRTMMISTDGHLDFDFGKIRIDKILLEEDAARAIERKETEVIYSLDRLGIPLIEMVVWHDMHTPEDTKKVALFIGQLFRTTGKVKRGLGSIRQDINISIAGGSRVEVKGCQDLDMIPEIIRREILRQINLLEIKDELKKRKIIEIKLKEKDLTSIFKQTESKAIKTALDQKKEIFGFSVSSFSGILGTEIQPNRRVGTELASILKAKTTLKGLFHCDELPNYGITEAEVVKIKQELKVADKDSYIIVMCDKKEIQCVREILEERLNQLIIAIPKETRLVNVEGNTEYQRPLSIGGTRMYPETDLLPIVFTEELLKEAKQEMPLSLDERKVLY